MKISLVFLIVASMPMQASAFYKCTDNDGETTYQNTPCIDGSSSEQVRVYLPKDTDLDKDSEYIDSQVSDPQSKAILLSKFNAALLSLTPLRLSSRQYYQLQGRWPEKLKDINIDKKSMQSQYIDAVDLDKNGSIIARLNAGFGNKKQIILQPKTVLGGTDMEWHCYANFSKEFLTINNHALCKSRTLN